MSQATYSAPNVSVIPATKRSVQNGGQLKQMNNLRVAAYCRVSTGDESQQTSYIKQREFYTNLINSRIGWTMAGVYADEAISGTSRAKRPQFNKMIEDAMSGKIDYIVTKSISRFARNTVDTLYCVRQLRQQNPPVGIYFEKENIDTLDAKGELILTILSALAQDESRSISDNIRWTFQKKFKEGKPQVNLNHLLGYRKGEKEEWVIVPEEAESVRFIFERYLLGWSGKKIADSLNELGKTTVLGNPWRSSAVYGILRNEKYVGDVEMQKTITKDFLTHRSSRNNGEAPKYYVENHHVGIIDRLTWDRTQAMLSARQFAPKGKKVCDGKEMVMKSGPIARTFQNLVCGDCGTPFRKKDYTGTAAGYSDERSCEAEGIEAGMFSEKYTYRYSILRCGKKFENRGHGCYSKKEMEEADARCSSPVLTEVAIQQSFMEMLYGIRRDYEENGEESKIARVFRKNYATASLQLMDQNYTIRRQEELSREIAELQESARQMLFKQVEAMREAALERNSALRQDLENGVLTIDDIDLDIRNGITGGDLGDISWSVWREGTSWNNDWEIAGRPLNFSGVLSEESEAGIYAGLVRDIQQKIKEKEREKKELEAEQSGLVDMKANYEFFLKCLMELPTTNAAGMPILVNGLDTDGSSFVTAAGEKRPGRKSDYGRGKLKFTQERIEKTPDFLHFDKPMYMSFIERGTVNGGIITYRTNFGVDLVSTGNDRKLAGFLGYRRCTETGKLEILTDRYMVSGRSIQYQRTPYKKQKKEV